MSKPSPKSLVSEINALHQENILAARSTAERAIVIGVKLHQLKELLPHGEFLPALEKEFPQLSERTCRKYMDLAEERLIEERAIGLLVAKSQNGKSASGADLKSDTVADLELLAIPHQIKEKAEKEVSEVSWFELPVKVEQLVKSIKGKELSELYQLYGITRPPKLRGTHERGPRDIRKEIEDAAEIDEETCNEFLTLAAMLHDGRSPIFGEQKTAMIHRVVRAAEAVVQRGNALLKARKGNSKGTPRTNNA